MHVAIIARERSNSIRCRANQVAARMGDYLALSITHLVRFEVPAPCNRDESYNLFSAQLELL